MTTSDASIFITRDALANQILEFGVRTGTDTGQTANGDWWSPDAAYARDLAEHLMSEFIVIEPEPEEEPEQAATEWARSVELKFEKVDPEVMALITGQSFPLKPPASNGRVKPTDTITIDGVTFPIPVNRDYTINNHMTRDEVYEALGIAPPPEADDRFADLLGNP